MKIIRKLLVDRESETRVIFGVPETSAEIHEMLKFRFKTYSRLNYINGNIYSSQIDFDRYDNLSNTFYLNAIVEKTGELFGAVRMINDSELPIFKAFQFNNKKGLPSNYSRHCEIGRLIITKPQNLDLPRNLILLHMIHILLEEGVRNEIEIAYAYVKEKLLKKLELLRIPINVIPDYKLIYPTNGYMYNYFNSTKDPVIPCFFTEGELKEYIDSIIGKRSLFKKIDNETYELQSNIYTNFLKMMGVI